MVEASISSSLPRRPQRNGYNFSSSPAFSAPWALEGAKTEMFPLQYGPGKGTVVSRFPCPGMNLP